MAAIHFFKRFDDGFALGLGFGVPHRVAQRFIGNIHRRFHTDIFVRIGILVNVTQQEMSIPISWQMESAIRLIDSEANWDFADSPKISETSP